MKGRFAEIDVNPVIAGPNETVAVDALIVGVPVHMDGSEQPMTHAARRFMKKLEQRFSLPVHASDERLSTREAQSRLKELNRSHDSDDPIAAQIILEGWLSNQGSTP